MRTEADLRAIHEFSHRHRELLARSERAGCFHCCAVFDPSEIRYWVDSREPQTGALEVGVTATCPRCGIDAVLPSAAPLPWDATLLGDMRSRWF